MCAAWDSERRRRTGFGGWARSHEEEEGWAPTDELEEAEQYALQTDGGPGMAQLCIRRNTARRLWRAVISAVRRRSRRPSDTRRSPGVRVQRHVRTLVLCSAAHVHNLNTQSQSHHGISTG